jgi:hypothetical protein
MKTYCFITMIAVFLLLSSNGIQAQTMQTESQKAGPEYDVLMPGLEPGIFREKH